jgi:hypothetical protein
VGGFGSSLFLKDSIAKVHPDIQVIQPNDAWSAIVQGAVLSKLPQEAIVVSSVAERHYGVSAGELFEPTRDAGHDEHKYWDEFQEIHRIKRMSWYISKVRHCLVLAQLRITSSMLMIMGRVTTLSVAAASISRFVPSFLRTLAQKSSK